MDKDELAHALQCVQSEIDLELMLEKRGLQLGENLAKLFTLREKMKALIQAASNEDKEKLKAV